MKEKIKKILILINQWEVILIIILVGIGLFYWYEWRPAQIRKECARKVIESAKGKDLSAYELSVGLDFCLTNKDF